MDPGNFPLNELAPTSDHLDCVMSSLMIGLFPKSNVEKLNGREIKCRQFWSTFSSCNKFFFECLFITLQPICCMGYHYRASFITLNHLSRDKCVFSSFCSSNALTRDGEKCYNYTITQMKVSERVRIEHPLTQGPVFMKNAGHAPKYPSLSTEWHRVALVTASFNFSSLIKGHKSRGKSARVWKRRRQKRHCEAWANWRCVDLWEKDVWMLLCF